MPCGGRIGAEREGPGCGAASQHGTGTGAPCRSDSGGRHTSRGHGRRAANRGGGGASDAGPAADRWGATTRGPGGSGWVRE
jgi:hypothetical protein